MDIDVKSAVGGINETDVEGMDFSDTTEEYVDWDEGTIEDDSDEDVDKLYNNIVCGPKCNVNFADKIGRTQENSIREVECIMDNLVNNVAENVIIVECLGGERAFESKSIVSKLSRITPYIKNISWSNKSSIKLPIRKKLFSHFVAYLSKRQVPLVSIQDAIELYKESKKYNIENLGKICRNYLINHIKIGNVCQIHDFACKQADEFIQFYCWRIFSEFLLQILKTDDFYHCKETTINRLVSRRIYNSINEIDLFQGIHKWVLIKCMKHEIVAYICVNCRLIIKPFLPNIRFLAMASSDFESIVVNSNILTSTEIRAIRSYHHTRDVATITSEKLSCVTTNRKGEHCGFLYCYKNREEFGYNISRLVKRADFFECDVVVNEDCFFTYLHLPISHVKQGDVNILLHFCLASNMKCLKVLNLKCDNYGFACITEPILLKKRYSYEMIVSIPDEELNGDYSIKILPDADAYVASLFIETWKQREKNLYVRNR
ncbi:uncharacterized protein LOC111626013 [Centruroides sculpturatus]|uniref:uncharacterized protein LOC111626013 n=1 Tax=Centruroides sculpturatus TaxID=218467 RepID=UPI000C6E9047|nr:uncharacterized protein LOC111626013 [Centruroides sculpturatus]